ncbi:uncharacterized protein METZ01_LOCUS314810, partial [marine metagenome]
GEVAKAVMVIARRSPNSKTIAWVNALGKAARSLPALEKEALRWLDLPAKEKSDAELIAAMTLVLRQGYKIAAPALMNAARNRKSESVHVAVVQSLAKFSQPKVGDDLLSLWPKASSRVHAEILAALVTRPERVNSLLGALEKNTVAKADIPASILNTLRAQKDGGTRARVTKLFGAPAKVKSRAQVLAEFQPSLKLKGNPVIGKTVFTQRCALCHRAVKEGNLLGPDLVAVKANGVEKLLISILDPNREVVANYMAYDVALKNGTTHTGLLGEETTTHIRIKLPLGQQVLLPRAQVKSMSSGGKSLMPEGLEAGVSPQQMADLLAFITGL